MVGGGREEHWDGGRREGRTPVMMGGGRMDGRLAAAVDEAVKIGGCVLEEARVRAAEEDEVRKVQEEKDLAERQRLEAEVRGHGVGRGSTTTALPCFARRRRS